MGAGGRPPIWDDAEAFAKKAEEYFTTEKNPTWSGLALYLGFESRQSLEDYKKKEEFSYPIKKALLRIENIYESNLQKGNPTGSIFALKNFGWKDKHDITNETIVRHLTISDDDPEYPIPIKEDEGSEGIPPGL